MNKVNNKNKNTKDDSKTKIKTTNTDQHGHYDIDGASFKDGVIYIASFWPVKRKRWKPN